MLDAYDSVRVGVVLGGIALYTYATASLAYDWGLGQGQTSAAEVYRETGEVSSCPPCPVETCPTEECPEPRPVFRVGEGDYQERDLGWSSSHSLLCDPVSGAWVIRAGSGEGAAIAFEPGKSHRDTFSASVHCQDRIEQYKATREMPLSR